MKRNDLLAGAVSGIPIGLGLGITAAVVLFTTDPNLRPMGLPLLVRIASGTIPAFVFTTLVVGFTSLGLSRLSPSAPARRAGAAIAGLLPWVSLCAWVSTSSASAVTLDPYTLGMVITESDVVFWIVYSAIGFGAVYPLIRWSRWLAGPHPSALDRVGAALLAASLGVGLAAGVWNQSVRVPAEKIVSTPPHVVVLAVDGLEWTLLEWLFAQDKLPNLRHLIETGSAGAISTFRPTLSPLIWTTIATGHAPSRHGITDFIEPKSKIPFTSNMRRVPAVWNLLSDAGIRVGIAGWWATWPAEQVNGHMVSSSSLPERGTRKGTLLAGLEDQTYPASFMREVEPLIEPAVVAGRREIVTVLNRTPMPPVDDMSSRRFVASWVFGADRIFGAVGERLARNYNPNFLAVYFSSTDTIAHLFCENKNPTSIGCRAPVTEAYEATDRRIGELLEQTAADATIIVVSDHGFELAKGHHAKGRFNGLPGVIVINGPGVRRGRAIEAASVYDIAPTILALFGQPITDDLRGRPLLSAFEDAYIEQLGIRYAKALDISDKNGSPVPIPSQNDEAVKERLRVLGYIE